MKQFKLIKEYPGSPELGIVVVENEILDVYESEGRYSFTWHEIEQFPEFWAPVGQEDKYKWEYNNPSAIGTHHWFNTLLGHAKSRAEYMVEKGLCYKTIDYPKDIFDILTDFKTAKEEGLIKLR